MEASIEKAQPSQPHSKDGTAGKKTDLTKIQVPSCSTTCSRGISYSNATKNCCQTQHTEIEPIHKVIVNENKSEILNQMEVKKLPAAEKLIGYILKTYPLLSRDEAYNYMIKVRNQNGGKLSDLRIPTIIQRIGELIPRKGEIKSSPLRGASKHQQVVSVHKGSSSINLPDECSICFEDMKNNLHGPVTVLEPCGHSFHTVCIKQWFIEKRDCPFCRNFTLLKDDYPKLRLIA